jgi:hypothetical protein
MEVQMVLQRSYRDIVEMFGEDIQHLDSNLYRVRFSIIKAANAGLISENGRLFYGNPRWIRNPEGHLVARGIKGNGLQHKIESKKMDELRESIARNGLENPLRLRITENDEPALEIIGGERRWRSISYLCDNEEIVIDPETGNEVPAKEQFEWVHVRINDMDDDTALEMAFRPNETGETIGEGASVEVVEKLRACNYDDDRILKITGKSISWLYDTDQILDLDEKSFAAFKNEEINRAMALRLRGVEDINLRLKKLEAVQFKALEKFVARKKLLEESIEMSETVVQIGFAEQRIAEMDGDEESANEIGDDIQDAKSVVDNLKQELYDHEQQGPKAKTSDDDEDKPFTTAKIHKGIYIPVVEIVKSNGVDEDGNALEINLDDAKLVKKVLEIILNGKKEMKGSKNPYPILKLLMKHHQDQ